MSAPLRPLGGPAGVAAEAVFRLLTGVRNTFYTKGWIRAHRLPARVISVGNLTVGGTGKTPVAIEIAARLLGAGARVALLSRGYGRTGASELREVPPSEPLPPGGASLYGDEPCLIRRRLPSLPIILSSDRVKGGRLALEKYGADHILLDDGMQHRRIARDAEVVVLHGKRPFGNGRLLPRGTLREPPGALRRAGFLFLNETEGTCSDLDERLLDAGAPDRRIRFRYAPGELIDPRGENLGAKALCGETVFALSGIGNPASFEATLLEAGATIAGMRRFRDHHTFTRSELESVSLAADRAGAMLVTTEKDAVRIARADAANYRIHALTVTFEITAGAEEFDRLTRTGEGGHPHGDA